MPIRDRLRRLLNPEKTANTPPAPARPAASTGGAEAPSADKPAAAAADHELVLYKYDACPFCRRVMRVVDDLGLQDRIEYRDTRMEPKWRADLIDRTGRTQVPCLFIDGEAMFESADINDWLRSQYA